MSDERNEGHWTMSPFWPQKYKKFTTKTRFNNIFVILGAHGPGCDQSRIKAEVEHISRAIESLSKITTQNFNQPIIALHCNCLSPIPDVRALSAPIFLFLKPNKFYHFKLTQIKITGLVIQVSMSLNSLV